MQLKQSDLKSEFSDCLYLVRYRIQSEVFQVLPLLKGDVPLKGADISRQSWLQGPRNRNLSKVTTVPHYRVHS